MNRILAPVLLPRLHCRKVKWWRQTIRRPPRRSEGDDGQLGDRWQPVIQVCLLRFFKCQRQNDCRRMLYRIKVRFHFHWLECPQQPHRFAALDRSAPDCQFGASLAFLISISSTIPSLLPLAFRMIKLLYVSEGRELNYVLAGTGKLMTLHGILFAAGLLIQ